VDALLIGTGGTAGWPQPGCRCASCMRASSAGVHRAPGRVLVDRALEFIPGRSSTEVPPQAAPAHRVEQLPGGWDITGPDGGRLLLAAGPGEIPEPPDGSAPYDIALLDLLASPAQLGLLRSTGLVRGQTAVAALYTDHRIRSAEELDRRCELWGASPGQDGQLITTRQAAVRPPGQRPYRTLIIGGARSGKSTEAELRLAGEPRVTYLAAGPWAAAESWTGPDGEPDAEWEGRVARHRARRPQWWQTAETLDVAAALRRETGALLIDGIGTWLAGIMAEAGMWAADATTMQARTAEAEPSGLEPGHALAAKVDELIDAWRQTSALVVAVTDQVGSGLVPVYPAGRIFRDQLGWLNQRLAAESELNLQVVAGVVGSLPG